MRPTDPTPADPEFVRRVRAAINFPWFSQVNVDQVARKITEITSIDPLLGRSLMRTMELYQWAMVNHEMVEIPVEDTSLDFPPQKLVQVAIRRDRRIQISRSSWRLMPDSHQSATTFHEIAYALLKPKCRICASPV